jgi:hypothetical protein
MEISELAKKIWDGRHQRDCSIPSWKNLPLSQKQEFICEVWLISYTLQRAKENFSCDHN